MNVVRMILAGAVLACGATSAMAGQKIMATAPAAQYYPVFGAPMKCNILNMNTSAKQVIVEAVDYVGIVVDTSGPLVLAPQTGVSVLAASGQAAWCRFTVDGNPKKYRAVAVYDDGTAYTSSQIAK